MKPSRALFLAVFLLGVAVAATFHASGAISETDARLALAARDGSLALSPPAPVSSRVFHLCLELVRVVWMPTGLFRALHLGAGLLLAFAAATSALVAARLGATRGASGLAGAILVGASMLFGGDLGGVGLQAQPAPVLLALLSGSVWAWTSPTPRAALGGFLLGLATAEHPFVLFLLPGFGAFALQATLRVSPPLGSGLLRRGVATFLLGFAAVFLPILDASNAGLVHATTPHSPLGALAAWSGGADGLFWTLGGPRRWVGAIVELSLALWGNAGPIGLVAGLLGLGFFFSGATRQARPFLVVHGAIATAIVLGTPKDSATALVLAAWSFLFWALPTLASLERRLAERWDGDVDRAAKLVPVAGLLATALLFAMNAREIDRARERGVEWTSTVLETLPKDSILLTRNWVGLAVAADGLRPDLDVVHVEAPSTLTAFRSGALLLPLGESPPKGPLDADAIHSLASASERPVFFDASIYFDIQRRTKLLDGGWHAVPHGLAYRLAPAEWEPSGAERTAAALAWDGVNVTPDSPPSPLRDGLGGSAYFARSLVQSAYLHLEQGRDDDAEREFLLAMGHPAANQNLATLGYARLLHSHRNWREVVRTIDARARDDQEGAWVARSLEGNTYALMGDSRRAILALQQALRLTPESMPNERARISRTIRELQARPGPNDSTPRPRSG